MNKRTVLKPLLALAGGAALLLGTGAAQAGGDNLYWSVGVSSPGVYVGVASAPPVVVRPPVYYAPPPVVYVPARPVMYGPPLGWGHRHHHHHPHAGWYGGPGGHGGGHRGGHGGWHR